LKEIWEALTLYKLYPNEYRFGDHATSTTSRISNERGADVLNKRGANISNERGADISNEKDDILNERGADIISNEKKDDISNERGADITHPRRSSWLKRKEKLPEKCLKTIAKLGVILFTSSDIVQPNMTSIQPPISPSDNTLWMNHGYVFDMHIKTILYINLVGNGYQSI
jgi:hypothetical protein